MKKVSLILAFAALIACNKETLIQESTPEVSGIVFNIDVSQSNETKGIKSGWANGDKVYLFFKGLVGQDKYAIFTYNGTSWEKDANGIVATDLTDEAVATDKRLTSICVPFGVSPVFTTSGDTFVVTEGINSFYLSGTATYTTVYIEGESSIEVSASLDLRAPDNLIQFYAAEESSPGADNEYILTVNNIKPISVEEIVPGEAIPCTTGTTHYPLPGVNATIGGDAGYYFWGILDNASAGAIDYNFQLVTRNADKKYALSSKSKTAQNKNLTGAVAIKLTNFTDNGYFVSLGYPGCPLWATGNLKDNGTIEDPLEPGNYYKWGYTTPYDVTGSTDPYANYKGDSDFEDTATSKNPNWRMPTHTEYETLFSSANTTSLWKTDWTSLGTAKGGRLFTSNHNGVSVFFAAAGRYFSGAISNPGYDGNYWSSTVSGPSSAYAPNFDNSKVIVFDGNGRNYGFTIRPVKD